MKKITGIMLTCFLMICNSIYIYADDTIDNRIDILTQSNDYNEITDRKEEIEMNFRIFNWNMRKV